MPIITINLLTGRDELQKALIARGVIEVVARIGGVRRDAITTIFQDVERENWAAGPTLMSERAPSAGRPAETTYVVVAPVVVSDANRSADLRALRDEILGVRRQAPGFLSAVVAASPDGSHVRIEQWRDREAYDSFRGSSAVTSEGFAGDVVDLWGLDEDQDGR